jgi:hypothetical protein
MVRQEGDRMAVDHDRRCVQCWPAGALQPVRKHVPQQVQLDHEVVVVVVQLVGDAVGHNEEVHNLGEAEDGNISPDRHLQEVLPVGVLKRTAVVGPDPLPGVTNRR